MWFHCFIDGTPTFSVPPLWLRRVISNVNFQDRYELVFLSNSAEGQPELCNKTLTQKIDWRLNRTVAIMFTAIVTALSPGVMAERRKVRRVDYGLCVTVLDSLRSLVKHPDGEPFVESPSC